MVFPYKSDEKVSSIYSQVNKCPAASIADIRSEDFHIKHALVQRSWFELRDKLRARYPVLTSVDVEYEPGKKCEMMRRIEEKLNMSPEKLQRTLSEL